MQKRRGEKETLAYVKPLFFNPELVFFPPSSKNGKLLF
jgi:hypothetical protein